MSNNHTNHGIDFVALLPHSGQNLTSAGMFLLQLGHVLRLVELLMRCPHFGHAAYSGDTRLPQAGQSINFKVIWFLR